MTTTSIEWVLNSDGTPGYALNLWVGCTKISPACDNCYAETSRVSACLCVKWGDDNPRKKCNPYKKLTSINNKAEKQGIRIRVFINPDSDIFDNKASQEWRDEFFSFVWSTPNIDYILVTKRVGNAKRMIPQHWLDNGYPANVWQLITVCNQAEADMDIPKLLELNATVRGLSIEPMLGEIDLVSPSLWSDGWMPSYSNPDNSGGHQEAEPLFLGLNWVIVGGESGKNARPLNPAWARLIRDMCINANVPFFFKQWGEWADSESASISLSEVIKLNQHIFSLGDRPVYKVGTKRAGNVLDGKVWQQMPVDKK